MNTPQRPLLLIVDDDPLITDALGYALGRDFEILTSATRPQAMRLLHQLRAPPAAALVDLGLPPIPHQPDEGFALISELAAQAPDTRIVVLSGQDDEAHARHARTLGAADFIGKPCNPSELADRLHRLLAVGGRPAAARDDAWALVGTSPAINDLRDKATQFADSPFPVLIEGESGSGKEVVARGCLHARSRRADRPFIALNCAAIAPTLVEPTLFGHAKGAYTGAQQARSGYFEDAADGTLFLDEIGELPVDAQAKLLRVLETGEYQRVGETQTRHVRARIIAATNRDLRLEVRENRFRSDLYHRLSVLTITVPPLRELGDDRLLLLDHFLARYVQESSQPPFILDTEARRLWRAYDFPGNVRELRNIVIRLLAKYPAQTIDSTLLAGEFEIAPSLGGATTALPEDMNTLLPLAIARLRQDEDFDLDHALRLYERALIDAALEVASGNVSKAARLLNISRTTLYSRMEAREKARA
ncbi:MAG TPA: sigma-54 dependent transcriptional regulator [Rhodocyclaceae bacterium]